MHDPCTLPLLLGLTLAAAPAPAAKLSAPEIVARHVAAKGGLERLQAIESLRATGKALTGGGDSVTEMDYVQVLKRPGRLRVERSIQGLTAVTAFDGEVGWRVSPFGGRREPDQLPPDVVKSLAVAADIDGPLIDFEKKGHRVEALGTEDVDGTDALKLQVTLKNGDVQFYYLDPEHYLTIRVLSLEKRRGVEEVSETDYGEYQQVAGVWFPFSIESGEKGMPRRSKVVLEKLEANVPIDDALFRFPAAAPGAVPAKGAAR